MSEISSGSEDFSNHITIEKMIIRGLSRMMKKHFNLSREPLFISTTDKWNVINSLRKQKDPRTEFPFMTFKLMSIEVNLQSYNPKSLERWGVVGEFNDSVNGAYKTQPIPVNITLEMTYITDDMYKMLNFANNWLYVSIRKLLNMDIEFDGINYSVQCETDASLSIPEKDMQIEQVNAYEMTSSIIAHGYVSPAIPLESFPKVYPYLGVSTIGFGLLEPYPVTDEVRANRCGVTPLYEPTKGEIIDRIRFQMDEDGNARILTDNQN